MSKIDTLPETKSTMTEQKIGYSLKIASQTIKSQLKKKEKEVSSEIRRLTKILEDKICIPTLREDFGEALTDTATLVIDNDPDLHCLVIAYNYMNADDPVQSNSDLITEMNLYNITHNLITPRYTAVSYFEGILEKGTVKVNFELGIGSLNRQQLRETKSGDNCHGIETGMELEIPLPIFIQDYLEEILPTLQEMVILHESLVDIRDKMEDVPNNLKDVEAQLLVQELQQTESGKRVLSITGNIINDVVGNQVTLEHGA